MAFTIIPDWVGANLDLYQIDEVVGQGKNVYRLKWLGERGAVQVGGTITQEKWNEMQKGVPQYIEQVEYLENNYVCTLNGLKDKGSHKNGIDLFDGFEIKMPIKEPNKNEETNIVINKHNIPIKKVNATGDLINIEQNELIKGLVYNFIYNQNDNAFICRELSLISVKALESLKNKINNQIEQFKATLQSANELIMSEFRNNLDTFKIRELSKITTGIEEFKREKETNITSFIENLRQQLEPTKRKIEELRGLLQEVENLKSDILNGLEQQKENIKNEILETVESFKNEKTRELTSLKTNLEETHQNLTQSLENAKNTTTRFNQELETLKSNIESFKTEKREEITRSLLEFENNSIDRFLQREATDNNLGTITLNKVRELANENINENKVNELIESKGLAKSWTSENKVLELISSNARSEEQVKELIRDNAPRVDIATADDIQNYLLVGDRANRFTPNTSKDELYILIETNIENVEVDKFRIFASSRREDFLKICKNDTGFIVKMSKRNELLEVLYSLSIDSNTNTPVDEPCLILETANSGWRPYYKSYIKFFEIDVYSEMVNIGYEKFEFIKNYPWLIMSLGRTGYSGLEKIYKFRI